MTVNPSEYQTQLAMPDTQEQEVLASIATTTGMNLSQPLKFYLAARYSRQAELRGYREQLIEMGHFVTSRWLDETADDDVSVEGPLAAMSAEQDIEDIIEADVLVNFTETSAWPSPRGGRHVELGIGIGLRLNGLGPTIFLVGPKENVFHSAQPVDGRFRSWTPFQATLAKTPLMHGEGVTSGGPRFCGAHPWHKAGAIHRTNYPPPLNAETEFLVEQMNRSLAEEIVNELGTARCLCGHLSCHHNALIYATLTGGPQGRGCDDCGCAYFCPD